MTLKPLAYQVPEIPDIMYPPYQLAAGGDVRAAVQRDCEHLPRALADFPAGAATVAIQMLYLPAAPGQDLRRRLSLFLTGQAHQKDAAEALSILLGQGPFGRFYNFQEYPHPLPVPWDSFHGACSVVRRQLLLDPTVTPESNVHALPVYYQIEPLIPRTDNDYLPLDHVLSMFKEPAFLEICVESADVRPLGMVFTRYLSRLQQVNRSWDAEADDFRLDSPPRNIGEFDFSARPPAPLRVRDPLADEVLRHAQRFHETLSQPHLKFHIRAWASTPALARLLASTEAECAFADGSYQLIDSVRGEAAALRSHAPLHALATPLPQRFIEQENLRLYKDLWRLGDVATDKELSSALRFLLGSHSSPSCIRKNTDPPAADTKEVIVCGYDAQIDTKNPQDPAHRVPLGIRECDLPKGVFVVGMPGYGKTTFIINMLLQLAVRNIPFLVFEPAKTEYRVLKCLKQHPDPAVRQLAQELQVFTPGNEEVSPFRINPLIKPFGIGLDQHIENILACFDAAFPLEGPMRLLLKQALEQVYEDHPHATPRMADLVAAARKVLASKGYAGEVDSNLRAAIGLRLESLTRGAMGQIFGCGEDMPTLAQLLTGRSIIELAALTQEPAALVTLFILTRLTEEVRVTPADHPVRFVLGLEEAHNLAGRQRAAAASEENANPEAHASEFICRMLVEYRALGVGIVIADQFCSAVAETVSKSTATKMAFRQVTKDEREEMGDMMLCSALEKEELARLQPGEGFLFTESYFASRRIRTPNVRVDLGMPPEPRGNAILPYLVEDPWFIHAAAQRVAAEMGQLRREMDRFEDLRIQIVAQARRLFQDRRRIMTNPPSSQSRAALDALTKTARGLRDRLQRAFVTFGRFTYRPLLREAGCAVPLPPEVQTLREQLEQRWEKVIATDIATFLRKMDDLIRDCQQTTS